MTAELGVRSFSRNAQPLLDRAVRRLGRAVESGALDAFDVTVTGETFVPGSLAARTATGRELSSLLADVRDWAARTGATVAPYFEPESVDCAFTSDRYTAARFPTLSLWEYHDGELAFVAPARIDGELVDVLDRIETITEPRDDQARAPVPE